MALHRLKAAESVLSGQLPVSHHAFGEGEGKDERWALLAAAVSRGEVDTLRDRESELYKAVFGAFRDVSAR